MTDVYVVKQYLPDGEMWIVGVTASFEGAEKLLKWHLDLANLIRGEWTFVASHNVWQADVTGDSIPPNSTICSIQRFTVQGDES